MAKYGSMLIGIRLNVLRKCFPIKSMVKWIIASILWLTRGHKTEKGVGRRKQTRMRLFTAPKRLRNEINLFAFFDRTSNKSQLLVHRLMYEG